jgi:hypothetical protein
MAELVADPNDVLLAPDPQDDLNQASDLRDAVHGGSEVAVHDNDVQSLLRESRPEALVPGMDDGPVAGPRPAGSLMSNSQKLARERAQRRQSKNLEVDAITGAAPTVEQFKAAQVIASLQDTIRPSEVQSTTKAASTSTPTAAKPNPDPNQAVTSSDPNQATPTADPNSSTPAPTADPNAQSKAALAGSSTSTGPQTKEQRDSLRYLGSKADNARADNLRQIAKIREETQKCGQAQTVNLSSVPVRVVCAMSEADFNKLDPSQQADLTKRNEKMQELLARVKVAHEKVRDDIWAVHGLNGNDHILQFQPGQRKAMHDYLSAVQELREADKRDNQFMVAEVSNPLARRDLRIQYIPGIESKYPPDGMRGTVIEHRGSSRSHTLGEVSISLDLKKVPGLKDWDGDPNNLNYAQRRSINQAFTAIELAHARGLDKPRVLAQLEKATGQEYAVKDMDRLELYRDPFQVPLIGVAGSSVAGSQAAAAKGMLWLVERDPASAGRVGFDTDYLSWKTTGDTRSVNQMGLFGADGISVNVTGAAASLSQGPQSNLDRIALRIDRRQAVPDEWIAALTRDEVLELTKLSFGRRLAAQKDANPILAAALYKPGEDVDVSAWNAEAVSVLTAEQVQGLKDSGKLTELAGLRTASDMIEAVLHDPADASVDISHWSKEAVQLLTTDQLIALGDGIFQLNPKENLSDQQLEELHERGYFREVEDVVVQPERDLVNTRSRGDGPANWRVPGVGRVNPRWLRERMGILQQGADLSSALAGSGVGQQSALRQLATGKDLNTDPIRKAILEQSIACNIEYEPLQISYDVERAKNDAVYSDQVLALDKEVAKWRTLHPQFLEVIDTYGIREHVLDYPVQVRQPLQAFLEQSNHLKNLSVEAVNNGIELTAEIDPAVAERGGSEIKYVEGMMAEFPDPWQDAQPSVFLAPGAAPRVFKKACGHLAEVAVERFLAQTPDGYVPTEAYVITNDLGEKVPLRADAAEAYMVFEDCVDALEESQKKIEALEREVAQAERRVETLAAQHEVQDQKAAKQAQQRAIREQVRLQRRLEKAARGAVRGKGIKPPRMNQGRRWQNVEANREAKQAWQMEERLADLSESSHALSGAQQNHEELQGVLQRTIYELQDYGFVVVHAPERTSRN